MNCVVIKSVKKQNFSYCGFSKVNTLCLCPKSFGVMSALLTPSDLNYVPIIGKKINNAVFLSKIHSKTMLNIIFYCFLKCLLQWTVGHNSYKVMKNRSFVCCFFFLFLCETNVERKIKVFRLMHECFMWLPINKKNNHV